MIPAANPVVTCRMRGHDWDTKPPSYMFNPTYTPPPEPVKHTCLRCGCVVTELPNGGRTYAYPTWPL